MCCEEVRHFNRKFYESPAADETMCKANLGETQSSCSMMREPWGPCLSIQGIIQLMRASTSNQPDGTQVVQRTARILRAVAQASAAGDSLAGISQRIGLPRSTVHRILGCLVQEGLLERTAGRLYRIGPLIYELGLKPAPSADDVMRWRHVIEAVAHRTGVTSYLMRRSGLEAVCLIKVDGNALVRFVPVEVGQRRLLGVGAGATALLAALDSEQLNTVLDAIQPGLRRYPRITAESLHDAIALVQRSGFAVSQGTVVDRGFGLGCVIPRAEGPSNVAFSIAVHATMVTESRIADWKKILLEEIEQECQARA